MYEQSRAGNAGGVMMIRSGITTEKFLRPSIKHVVRISGLFTSTFVFASLFTISQRAKRKFTVNWN